MWLHIPLHRQDTFYAHAYNKVVILNADDDRAYYRPNNECYQQLTKMISFHCRFSHESNEEINEGFEGKAAKWSNTCSDNIDKLPRNTSQCRSHHMRLSHRLLLQISTVWQFANIISVLHLRLPRQWTSGMWRHVVWQTGIKRFGGNYYLHYQGSLKMGDSIFHRNLQNMKSHPKTPKSSYPHTFAQSTYIIRIFNTDKNIFSKLTGSERRSCNFFKMLGITHRIFKLSSVTKHIRMRIHMTLWKQYHLTLVNDGHEQLMLEDIPAQMHCKKTAE
jgi:hypothetical protein